MRRTATAAGLFLRARRRLSTFKIDFFEAEQSEQSEELEWLGLEDEGPLEFSAEARLWQASAEAEEAPGPRAEAQELIAAVPQMLHVPNVDNFLLVERKLEELARRIPHVQVKMKLHLVYSKLTMLKMQNNIDSILQIGADSLTGAHLDLRDNNEYITQQMGAVVYELVQAKHFLVVKELLGFLETLGISHLRFLVVILKTAALGFDAAHLPALQELLDYLVEKSLDFFEYGGFLHQVMVNELQMPLEQCLGEKEKIQVMNFVFNNLRFSAEDDPAREERLLEMFNLPFCSGALSLAELLESNAAFAREWGRRKWYRKPEKFDFEGSREVLRDPHLQILCEVDHFLDLNVQLMSDFTAFHEKGTAFWTLLEHVGRAPDRDARAALFEFFASFSKLLVYLRVDTFCFALNPSSLDRELFSEVCNRVFRDCLATHSLERFLFENLQFLEAVVDQREALRLDEPVLAALAGALLRLPYSLLVVGDQMTFLFCLAGLLPVFARLEGGFDRALLKKHVLSLLHLNSEFKQFKRSQEHMLRIVHLFPRDEEVYAKIVFHLSAFFKTREINFIAADFDPMEAHKLLARSDYMESVVLLQLLFAAQGFLHLIRRTELYEFFKFANAYSLAKTFGLSNWDVLKAHRSLRREVFDCLDPRSVARFEREVAVHYAPAPEPDRETYFVSLLLLDARVRALLETELGFE